MDTADLGPGSLGLCGRISLLTKEQGRGVGRVSKHRDTFFSLPATLALCLVCGPRLVSRGRVWGGPRAAARRAAGGGRLSTLESRRTSRGENSVSRLGLTGFAC